MSGHEFVHLRVWHETEQAGGEKDASGKTITYGHYARRSDGR
jgi:hypothetical protein